MKGLLTAFRVLQCFVRGRGSRTLCFDRGFHGDLQGSWVRAWYWDVGFCVFGLAVRGSWSWRSGLRPVGLG